MFDAPDRSPSTTTRRALIAALSVAALPVAARRASARQDDATPAAADAAQPAAEGEWSFTDDRGETITLPARPERIVAQSGSAAALWDYGIRPVAVFGPQRNPDGSNAVDIGNVDVESVESIGEAWGEFDLEKLLALDVDLLVGPLHPLGDIWYLPVETAPLLDGNVPIVGIYFTGGVSATHIMERYEELAAALGADLDAPEVVEAREEFDAAAEELRAAIAEKPGLKVLAVSGTPEAFYVASASFAADLVFLKELGLDIIQHGTEGMWEDMSWEQADRYPAGLILVDERAGAMKPDEYAAIDTWTALPAVQAGQLGPWRTELPYSRRGYAEYLRDLAEAVRNAEVGIA